MREAHVAHPLAPRARLGIGLVRQDLPGPRDVGRAHHERELVERVGRDRAVATHERKHVALAALAHEDHRAPAATPITHGLRRLRPERVEAVRGEARPRRREQERRARRIERGPRRQDVGHELERRGARTSAKTEKNRGGRGVFLASSEPRDVARARGQTLFDLALLRDLGAGKGRHASCHQGSSRHLP